MPTITGWSAIGVAVSIAMLIGETLNWPRARTPFLAVAVLVGIFCALWTWRIMQDWKTAPTGASRG